jgi:hypothetical protein
MPFCRRKALLPTGAILARFGDRVPLYLAALRLRCDLRGTPRGD